MKNTVPAETSAPTAEPAAEPELPVAELTDKQRRKAAEKLAKEAVKRFQAARAKGKPSFQGQTSSHTSADAKLPNAPSVAKPMTMKIPAI